MPWACEIHEQAIRNVENEFRKKGYQTIINAADQPRIPDLLMISNKGKLLWLEVEWQRTPKNNTRFQEIRRDLSVVNGEFHIRYLTLPRSGQKVEGGEKYTRLAKESK